jgi:hypothetical protein
MVRDEMISCAERLAQFAWAIHTGDRETLCELRRIIEAGGGTWKENEHQVTCTGPSGIASGFVPGYEDPVTACVVVSFLLVGPLWPKVPFVKEAFDILQKWWREEIKSTVRRDKKYGP